MQDNTNAMPTADSSVQGGATGTNQIGRSNAGTGSSQGSTSNTNNQSSNGTQNNIVIGVPYKAIDKRVPFDVFREAISNYIVSEFKGGSNV
eukprot:4289442-Ditylum_brightwellii.AAC.1